MMSDDLITAEASFHVKMREFHCQHWAYLNVVFRKLTFDFRVHGQEQLPELN
jgi:hypothetical protein